MKDCVSGHNKIDDSRKKSNVRLTPEFRRSVLKPPLSPVKDFSSERKLQPFILPVMDTKDFLAGIIECFCRPPVAVQGPAMLA